MSSTRCEISRTAKEWTASSILMSHFTSPPRISLMYETPVFLPISAAAGCYNLAIAGTSLYRKWLTHDTFSPPCIRQTPDKRLEILLLCSDWWQKPCASVSISVPSVKHKEQWQTGSRNAESRQNERDRKRRPGRRERPVIGETDEEEKEEKLVHTAPPCRPCIHTYSRTVQAADINNSLLIFICSGEMWGQSNPDTNRLSTCLSAPSFLPHV